MAPEPFDAVIVGSGPNGLAAATVLAQAGLSVRVLEGKEAPGGGLRSSELTAPGFVHDLCSTVHPLGAGSPFFQTLPLREHGLEWVYPTADAAHPLEDGTAVLLERSLEATADGLGRDGPAYRRLFEPLVRGWTDLAPDVLAPPGLPRHPALFARFGFLALGSARGLAETKFHGPRARALFAGLAAHGTLPIDRPLTASFGLVLGTLGHAAGWPFPRGGAQRLADALISHLTSLGGEVIGGRLVTAAADLPKAKALVLDLTPRQILRIAGLDLPASAQRRLTGHTYGPGVFKMDWALSGPIPWRAAECGRAGTVHVGGTLEEIAASERAVWRGEHPLRPYLIVAQHTLFDPTRAPSGRHTAWAYCHVPNGSAFDMADRVEGQLERFAPGFRDCVLARSATPPARLEEQNPNCVGGDISGGILDLGHLFRSALSPAPYTLVPGRTYMCSASTPPGGGVHGMCGYHAAGALLRERR